MIHERVLAGQRALGRQMRDERIAERTRRVRKGETDLELPSRLQEDDAVTAPDGAYEPRQDERGPSTTNRAPMETSRNRSVKDALDALRRKVRSRTPVSDPGDARVGAAAKPPTPVPAEAGDGSVGIEGHADRLDQLIGTLEEKYGN